MKRSITYPTWNPEPQSGEHVSLEQMDGAPDFRVFPSEGQWWFKWRSSAMTNGPYRTAASGRRAVEEEFGDEGPPIPRRRKAT